MQDNEPVLSQDCPCTNKCVRHGNCVECVRHHLNTPTVGIVVCMQEKAKKIYCGDNCVIPKAK